MVRIICLAALSILAGCGGGAWPSPPCPAGTVKVQNSSRGGITSHHEKVAVCGVL